MSDIERVAERSLHKLLRLRSRQMKGRAMHRVVRCRMTREGLYVGLAANHRFQFYLVPRANGAAAFIDAFKAESVRAATELFT